MNEVPSLLELVRDRPDSNLYQPFPKAHIFHPLAGEQAAYFLSHLKATKKTGHITPALPSCQIRLTVPTRTGGTGSPNWDAWSSVRQISKWGAKQAA